MTDVNPRKELPCCADAEIDCSETTALVILILNIPKPQNPKTPYVRESI